MNQLVLPLYCNTKGIHILSLLKEILLQSRSDVSKVLILVFLPAFRSSHLSVSFITI